MYITTFYSFKGGVGRSMGLVNVAYEMVKRGKKVLIVDFDLEAPGLTTFGLNIENTKSLGVVDFVNHYLEFKLSPDVSEYITKCNIEPQDTDGQLWLMPAGNASSEYSNNLSKINWRDLYENKMGFLLFEDLKAQWKEFCDFDYVLIDSRTGHTDVSGICTRQLPNAIVFLFFPNQQNLEGLTKVVEKVEAENKNLKEPITKHFVTSNVPDLDDENNILEVRLNSFSEKLKYKDLTCTIHRYNSLALLNQVIFTAERPKTRLAKEYRELTDKIINSNLSDLDAAKNYLKILSTNLEDVKGDAITEVQDKLNEIQTAHNNDTDILTELAYIKEERGDFKEAYSIINKALSIEEDNLELLIRQSYIANILGEEDVVLNNTYKLMKQTYVDYYSLVMIVNLVIRTAMVELDTLLDSEVIKTAESQAILELATTYFSSSTDDLRYAEKLMVPIYSNFPELDSTYEVTRYLALIFIGRGRFKDACNLLFDLLDMNEMSDAYNYSIALWGKTGEVPIEEFYRFIEIANKNNMSNSSANYKQCFALANWVIGNKEKAFEFLEYSMEQVKEQNISTFSSWTYLYLTPNEYLQDLQSMKRAFSYEPSSENFPLIESKF